MSYLVNIEKAKARAQEQEAKAEAWNAKRKVGCWVRYQGKPVQTRTTAMVRYESAVVWLKGYAACVELDEIKPLRRKKKT